MVLGPGLKGSERTTTAASAMPFKLIVCITTVLAIIGSSAAQINSDDYEEPVEAPYEPWISRSSTFTNNIVSFELATSGGQSGCRAYGSQIASPVDTAKDRLYLGFANGSCWKQGANFVGPLLRKENQTAGWRQVSVCTILFYKNWQDGDRNIL